MLSLEPNRTPYDVYFPIFGIPVRIHPGFWIAAFILGYQSSQYVEQRNQPMVVLIFMGVMFVSILVHELGHALLMRRFGYLPRIVMYHFGGLAIPDAGYSSGFSKPQRDTWSSVLTSLAGPGAGFAFAALVIVIVFALGGRVDLALENFPALPWDVDLPPSVGMPVFYLINYLLAINIFWGVINLAPVLPLDGGQVARDLLLHRDRYNGLVQSVQLSVAMGVIIAAFFWLTMKDEYAALMFGLLAISNFLTLQQLGRKW